MTMFLQSKTKHYMKYKIYKKNFRCLYLNKKIKLCYIEKTAKIYKKFVFFLCLEHYRFFYSNRIIKHHEDFSKITS